MKTSLKLTALTLILTMSLSLRASGQKTFLAKETTTTRYDGKIAGRLKIRMFLTERSIMRTENGETFAVGTQYSGYYIYVKQGKRIYISGNFDAQGVGGAVMYPRITLEENTKGRYTGYFEGRFNDRGVYSGIWHSADDKRQYPFRLYPRRAIRKRSLRAKTGS